MFHPHVSGYSILDGLALDGVLMQSENDGVSLLPLGEYLSAINESESNRRTLVAVSDDPDECLDLLVTLSKLEDREQELLEYRCKLKLFPSESNTKIAEVNRLIDEVQLALDTYQEHGQLSAFGYTSPITPVSETPNKNRTRVDNLNLAIKDALNKLGKEATTEDVWQYLAVEKRGATGYVAGYGVKNNNPCIKWLDTSGNLKSTSKTQLGRRINSLRTTTK